MEVARATILSEVSAVFGAYGIAVDQRHLSLIADFMTFHGAYRSAPRQPLRLRKGHSKPPDMPCCSKPVLVLMFWQKRAKSILEASSISYLSPCSLLPQCCISRRIPVSLWPLFCWSIDISVVELRLLLTHVVASTAIDHRLSLVHCRPCNRLGIESSPSPFLKMSFETATHFLTDATLQGQTDHLESPSARIVVGRVVEVGTGAFDILQNVGLAHPAAAPARNGS